MLFKSNTIAHFFFIGAFFASAASAAEISAADLATTLEKAHALRLDRDPYWLRLLHYHKNCLGRFRSDIDGGGFFLSKAGRTRPRAELDATIAAFFPPLPTAPAAEPASCHYSARFAWLDGKLNFPSTVPRPTCEHYESWRSKLDPDSVSLIFASYYMNNPASMYGHTFLRLSRRGAYKDDRLLDYTVNFAAETNTKNGLAFALLGLCGGYRGLFSTVPYYMKVQTYNNLESRDLWEYELTLSTTAIDRLVRHLWELGHTSMAYFFLNKNCSYQLLPLLEVAEPSYKLTGGRFRWRAIPLDTLRAVLNQRGAVKSVERRPSHVRKMIAERQSLDRQEMRLVSGLAQGDDIQSSDAPALKRLKALPPERQARALDAAYDYLKYRTGFHRDQTEETTLREGCGGEL